MPSHSGHTATLPPGRSGAAARLTCFLPRDIQPYLCAANRLPEIDVQRIFEVRSRAPAPALAAFVRAAPKNWLNISRNRTSATEVPSKSSVAARRPRRFAAAIYSLKSNPPKPMPPGPLPGWPAFGRNVVRVKPVLVVDLALLLVAQNVVRFLYFLEALLCRLVARIQIRMILSRKLPVRFADLIRARALSATARVS